MSFWSEAGFRTPKELNRLLARRMREQTAGDPWALDMARQDGWDFLLVKLRQGVQALISCAFIC
jgi:hypothetical protein